MTFNCMGPDATFAAAAALVVQHLVEVFYFGLHTLFFALFFAYSLHKRRTQPDVRQTLILALSNLRAFSYSLTRANAFPHPT